MKVYRVRHGYAVIDCGSRIGAYELARGMARAIAPCPTAAVVSVPGDLPDNLVRVIGRSVARGFDRFMVKDDDDRRGRKPLEAPMILADAIVDERPLVYCNICDDEQLAIRQTMATMRKREVVFIFTEQSARTSAMLEQMGGVLAERIESAVVNGAGMNLAAVPGQRSRSSSR